MKTILCYGDSNVRAYIPGSYDENTGLSGRFPKNKRWTGILQRKLGETYLIIEEGLNGRTTDVDEIDPGRPYRNGLKHLPMFLESHFPLDLVIVNLGTNDVKKQFHRSAKEITEGMKNVIKFIKTSNRGPNGKAPRVLVIAPPPILEVALPQDSSYDEHSLKTARELPEHYQRLAKEMGCEFLDASLLIKASEIDGVHFDEYSSELLGSALAKLVTQILR